MHDPGDLAVVERRLEAVEIGDVAADEVDARRVLPEDELEAGVVRPEVVADDLVPVVERRPRDPRAEAPEHARDEEALAHDWRGLEVDGRTGRP